MQLCMRLQKQQDAFDPGVTNGDSTCWLEGHRNSSVIMYELISLPYLGGLCYVCVRERMSNV